MTKTMDVLDSLAFARANRRRLLGEALAKNAVNFPDKTALHDIESGRTLSYREMNRRANRIAQALRAAGLDAGERICILGRNYPDTLVLYYAIAKIGAVAVPLNYYAIAEEQRYIVEDCAPKIAVVSTECIDTIDRSIFKGATVFTIAPDGRSGDVAGWAGSGGDDAAAAAPDLDVGDRAPAFILYTGGTTGRPKGVVLSQAGYLAMAESTVQALAPQGFGRNDSWLILGPLYHGAALAYAVIGLTLGQTVHLMREYNAAVALKALADGFGTITWFIPAMSRRTVDFVRAQNMDLKTLEGLRLIISAGAPLSLELRNELRATFRKCEVIDIVGQTEMTSTIIVHAEPADIARKPTAVGFPAPGVMVALLDEANRPVADGEVGELCYLGESLMLGYWNKPEATAEAMAGGWFHSGDLGRRDADGILSVVGRKKELIKTGGENVIPNEVEDVLRGVPGVADACVLGLQDERWGERVHAVVAVGPGASGIEALRARAEEACRARLSRFKVPKTWSVLEAMPVNAIGKFDKARLRAMVGDGNGPLDLRKTGA